MNVEIKKMGSLKLAGISVYGNPDNFEEAWNIFDREAFLEEGKELNNYYGVSFYPEDYEKKEKWFYFAGVLKNELNDMPASMVVKEIPAGVYAVVSFKGEAGDVEKAYESVYKKWLPESDYESADFYDLEIYKPGDEIEICIPVVKKQIS